MEKKVSRLEYLLNKQEIADLDKMERWELEQLLREGE